MKAVVWVQKLAAAYLKFQFQVTETFFFFPTEVKEKWSYLI